MVHNSQPPNRPSDVVRTEARALLELAIRLDGPMREPFQRAIDLIITSVSGRNRVILAGVGKSGLIARKISGTMRSTGTPAHFLHASEALHGDLGMLLPGDVLLIFSASGETEEILVLLPAFKRLGVSIISFCGSLCSTLAQASQVVLDCSITAEACPLNLAPTASTTVMLALGDALAVTLSSLQGFTASDFANLHPGGRLGQRLARVGDLMHSNEALPCVSPETPMHQVIHEMSHKKLGMTTVVGPPNVELRTASNVGTAGATDSGNAPHRLLGMISDGDLRRLLEKDGPNALGHTAGEILNSNPITIGPDAFAAEALALMEEKKITSLIVTTESGHTLGVVHLHDLWTAAPHRS